MTEQKCDCGGKIRPCDFFPGILPLKGTVSVPYENGRIDQYFVNAFICDKCGKITFYADMPKADGGQEKKQ